MAGEEGEFGIVTDEDADAGAGDVEDVERAGAGDEPLFAFEAGHLDFILEAGLAVGGAEPCAVGVGAVGLTPWEGGGEDGDAEGGGEVGVGGEEGIAPLLEVGDAGVEVGAEVVGLEASEFHGGVFREDEEGGTGGGGVAGEALEFREPCVEVFEAVDGVAAEGGLHGLGSGLVQKVRDCEVGAGLPISSHVKWVWRWVLEKPRCCQKESSGW